MEEGLIIIESHNNNNKTTRTNYFTFLYKNAPDKSEAHLIGSGE